MILRARMKHLRIPFVFLQTGFALGHRGLVGTQFGRDGQTVGRDGRRSRGAGTGGTGTGGAGFGARTWREGDGTFGE